MVPDASYKYDYYVSKELVKWRDGVYQLNLVESGKITESRKFVKR